MTSSLATDSITSDDDRIDLLIPSPHPWWVRLAIALVVVGGIGVLGWLWNVGAIRPAPDCCGSGSGQPMMGVSEVSGEVVVTAYFYNSGPRPLTIVEAAADLPGAQVTGIAPFDSPEFGQMLPPEGVALFPYRIEGRASAWLAISFVPDRCTDEGETDAGIWDGGDWGSVRLDLEVADDPWYPTLDRTFTLPEPVVRGGSGQLGVMTPSGAGQGIDSGLDPLAAACALLDE